MKMVEHKLTIDEKNRNKHGPMHLFKYTKKNLGMCVYILFKYKMYYFLSFV